MNNINKSRTTTIQRCDICKQYATQKEVDNKEFYYSKTKRGTGIYICPKCWDGYYTKGGKG